MAKIDLALFSDREHAEAAIGELERSGFDPKQISIMMKDVDEAKVVAQQAGASVAEGTVSGATTGGVLGGIAGLLIGIGAITVPGIGSLLVAGPLAAALGLTGAAATTLSGAVTGALAGGVVGALVGLGVPKEIAQVYEDRLKSGGVLLAIPSSDVNSAQVLDVLKAHGADQIEMIDVKTMATT